MVTESPSRVSVEVGIDGYWVHPGKLTMSDEGMVTNDEIARADDWLFAAGKPALSDEILAIIIASVRA